MKDYYKILGLSQGAEKRHIEAAFQEKVMRTFPGLETESEGRISTFQKEAEAYAVLHDDRSRKGYEYACSKSPTGFIVDETSGAAKAAANEIIGAIRRTLTDKQQVSGPFQPKDRSRELESDLWTYLFTTNFLPGPEPLHFSIPAAGTRPPAEETPAPAFPEPEEQDDAEPEQPSFYQQNNGGFIQPAAGDDRFEPGPAYYRPGDPAGQQGQPYGGFQTPQVQSQYDPSQHPYANMGQVRGARIKPILAVVIILGLMLLGVMAIIGPFSGNNGSSGNSGSGSTPAPSQSEQTPASLGDYDTLEEFVNDYPEVFEIAEQQISRSSGDEMTIKLDVEGNTVIYRITLTEAVPDDQVTVYEDVLKENLDADNLSEARVIFEGMGFEDVKFHVIVDDPNGRVLYDEVL